MADDDVSVQFGADTAGLQAGADTASEAVAAFGAQVGQITEAIQAQTAEISEGFAQIGGTVTAAMAEAREATEAENVSLGEMLASVREGAEAITEFRESIMGFGEAMLAVFAFDEIKEFVASLGEAGEQVQHTAQAFGMTTGDVQKLQAVFIMAGAGPEALQGAMARLDHTMTEAVSGNAKAAAAYKALGVSLTEPMTPAQRVQAVLEGLTNLPGPEKAQVAYELFGRGMVRYAGLIGATKEQLEEWLGTADKLGATNEEAAGKMAALGGAMNTNKVAMAGLQNVMGDALAPVFTLIVEDITNMVAAFNESYKSGGLAKTIMDDIATTINLLMVLFEEIGDIMGTMWDAVSTKTTKANTDVGGFRATLVATASVVVALGVAFQEVILFLEQVANDLNYVAQMADNAGLALHDIFNPTKSKADWSRGMAEIEANMKATTDRMVQVAADGQKRIDELLHPKINAEQSPTTVKTGVVGNGKTKKPKDDLVAEWQQELAEKEAASENWYADQNQLAADFWQKIKDGGAGSVKDQRQAALNLAQALKALDNEQVTSAVEAAKKKAEAAKGDVDAVKKVYSDLDDFLVAHHAATGPEFDKVEQAKVDAVRKATAEMQKLQVGDTQKGMDRQIKGVDADQKSTDKGFDTQRSQVSANGSAGVISAKAAAAQLAAIDQEQEKSDLAAVARKAEIEKAGYAKEIAEAGANTDLIDAIKERQLTAAQNLEDQKTQIIALAAEKQAQAQIAAQEKAQAAYAHSVNSVVNTFGMGFLHMAQGSTNFKAVVLGAVGSLETAFVQSIDKQVAQFIIGETTKKAAAAAGQAAQTAATTAGETARVATTQAGASQGLLINLETTLKNVTMNAVNAASAAYGAMAGIPIIGPALGAAAAAVTFTAVEAFGALASASGGYDIGNENPLTQLHAQEMVLPASIANPLRGMIAANGNGAPSAGSGGGARSGDTYNTHVSALDSRSVKRMMNNPGNVRAAGAAARKHA